MSNVLFLPLLVLHVLLAAVWIGSTVFMTFFVMPVFEQAGPAGGQMMVALNRKGLSAFFGALGGTTVLTGIYLFWRFTGGFDPVVSGSRAGIVYSIGGLAGLIAVVIGGSIVGRSARKAVELIEQATKLSETEKKARLQQVATLSQRMKSAGAIVIVLQVVALALMAIAHYV